MHNTYSVQEDLTGAIYLVYYRLCLTELTRSCQHARFCVEVFMRQKYLLDFRSFMYTHENIHIIPKQMTLLFLFLFFFFFFFFGRETLRHTCRITSQGREMVSTWHSGQYTSSHQQPVFEVDVEQSYMPAWGFPSAFFLSSFGLNKILFKTK